MRTLAVGILGAALVTGAQAPERPASKPVELHNVVVAAGKQMTLRIGTDQPAAAPGAKLTLLVDATPRAGMHVYAPGQPDYLPVDLKLDATPAATFAAAIYPPSRPLFLAPIAETVKVYDAPFRIRQPIVVAAAAPAAGGPLAITGVLRYQACDDSVCYVPDVVKIALSVPR